MPRIFSNFSIFAVQEIASAPSYNVNVDQQEKSWIPLTYLLSRVYRAKIHPLVRIRYNVVQQRTWCKSPGRGIVKHNWNRWYAQAYYPINCCLSYKTVPSKVLKSAIAQKSAMQFSRGRMLCVCVCVKQGCRIFLFDQKRNMRPLENCMADFCAMADLSTLLGTAFCRQEIKSLALIRANRASKSPLAQSGRDN